MNDCNKCKNVNEESKPFGRFEILEKSGMFNFFSERYFIIKLKT